MSEQQYKVVGWIFFVMSVLLALYSCMYEVGPAGKLMDFSEKTTHHRLTQIVWVVTFAIICFPGWMLKSYFESLAWKAHVRNLPPPDPRESAKRSKYVKVDAAPPPAPKPIKLENVAKSQQEFIATCPACGNFFSAKKQIGPTKCPACGEVVPVA